MNYLRQPLVVTGGYDFSLVVWNALHGTLIKQIPFPQSQVNCLITNHENLVIAGGYGCIRSYDTEACSSSDALCCFEGHAGNVTGLGTFKKFLYSAGDDGTVRIWSTEKNKDNYIYRNEVAIHCVCLHPEERHLIFGDRSGTIRIWDIIANKLIIEMEGNQTNSIIQSMSVSFDGQYLVTSDFNGVLSLYRLSNSEGTIQVQNGRLSLLETVNSHDGHYIPCVKFSPTENHLMTTTSIGQVESWRIQNAFQRKPTDIKVQPFQENEKLLDHSDSRPFSTGALDALDVPIINRIDKRSPVLSPLAGPQRWKEDLNSQTFTQMGKLLGHLKWVWDLVYSNDGAYVISVSSDQTAKLWDIKKHAEVMTYKGVHSKPLTAVTLLDVPTQIDDIELENDLLFFQQDNLRHRRYRNM